MVIKDSQPEQWRHVHAERDILESGHIELELHSPNPITRPNRGGRLVSRRNVFRAGLVAAGLALGWSARVFDETGGLEQRMTGADVARRMLEAGTAEANRLSYLLTSSLRSKGRVGPVQVLPGWLYQDVVGVQTPIVRNPILLATPSQSQSASMLEGGVFGVQSSAHPPEGIHILPVQFDANTMYFTPYTEHPLVNLSLAVAQTNGGLHALLGFANPDSNWPMRSPDGLPLQIGAIV